MPAVITELPEPAPGLGSSRPNLRDPANTGIPLDSYPVSGETGFGFRPVDFDRASLNANAGDAIPVPILPKMPLFHIVSERCKENIR